MSNAAKQGFGVRCKLAEAETRLRFGAGVVADEVSSRLCRLTMRAVPEFVGDFLLDGQVCG